MPDAGLLYFVIALAVTFDFINGFHDTANAIATVIATRVLSPLQAVLMAATLNFAGAIMGTAVAKTVGSGLVNTDKINLLVVTATLMAAICWNLITWSRGIPSSSSHALIGGLIGASLAQGGNETVHWMALLQKVIVPFMVSPIVGFLAAGLLLVLVLNLFGRLPRDRLSTAFGRLQLFSSALMAYSHGGNDAQKTMGIITLALVISGSQAEFQIPLWVTLLAGGAMALGTAVGGWRIIRTLSTKLGKLKPVDGFAAETAAASIIEVASHLGYPLSTTHVITTSILGAGVVRQPGNVRWSIAENILIAWVITLPIAAMIGYVACTFGNAIATLISTA